LWYLQRPEWLDPQVLQNLIHPSLVPEAPASPRYRQPVELALLQPQAREPMTGLRQRYLLIFQHLFL
jgi:hypothetical protein